MIALGILTTWLILTAGGFAGLSALRRAGIREDPETGIGGAVAGLSTSTLADVRIAIPQALLQ